MRCVLTVGIDGQWRCIEDEKKMKNKECEQHDQLLELMVLFLVSLLTRDETKLRSIPISHDIHLNEESTWISAGWTTIETGTRRRMGWASMFFVASCCYCRYTLCDRTNNERILFSPLLSSPLSLFPSFFFSFAVHRIVVRKASTVIALR